MREVGINIVVFPMIRNVGLRERRIVELGRGVGERRMKMKIKGLAHLLVQGEGINQRSLLLFQLSIHLLPTFPELVI